MIIKNIEVFNTSQKTFVINDVRIESGIFTQIGKLNEDIIPSTDEKIIDGSGKFILPGLIDIHMHIESSMTTPQEYSNTVLPLGTTTIVADAHEVANALGLDGLYEYMQYEQLLDVYYSVPSSVPSTNSHLETTKGYIGAAEVTELCTFPKIRALGEIMNFAEIVAETEDNHTKNIIAAFKKACPHFPIEGHIPLVTGRDLAQYVKAGIGSDHTHQNIASLLEKTKAGILIQLQEKSLNREILAAIKQYKLEEFICLVSDDVMPDDLYSKGHMNHLIRTAVNYGYPVEDAIYAATYVPARRMLFFDRGIIAPGKIADAVILSDLQNFIIDDVMKNGKFVSQLPKDAQPQYLHKFNNSIIRKKITEEDLKIKVSGKKIKVRVIERETKSTFTHEVFRWVDVENGILQWKKAGLNLLVVAERYGNNSSLAFGFVSNGFTGDCALVSSWVHDSHNILAMGNDEKKLLKVINKIIDEQGGMAIDGESDEGFLPLQFGGVVSLAPMAEIAKKLAKIRKIMIESGYISHNEIMSFCVLALLVTPSLKLSDKGYVDVRTQQILDWKVEEL